MKEKRKEEIIVLSMKIKGGKNSIIPKGITEELKVEIGNQVAIVKFKDGRITERFARHRQEVHDLPSKYVPRLQKAIFVYEGMTKEEIRNHFLNSIKELKGEEK